MLKNARAAVLGIALAAIILLVGASAGLWNGPF